MPVCKHALRSMTGAALEVSHPRTAARRRSVPQAECPATRDGRPGTGPMRRACVAVVAMLAAALLGAPVAALAANVVANPGFEDTDVSDWTPFAGAATLLRSTDEARSGGASMLVTERTQYYGGPSQDLNGTLVAGRRYEVSAWVKMSVESESHPAVYIKKVDGSGTKYTQVDTLTVNHDRWTELFGFYDYEPVGAVTELSVYVYVTGTATLVDFWVDDITVEEPPVYVPTPAAPEDFVRRDGAGLVVGAADDPIRLLGVNFVAYGDEDGSEDTVYATQNFDARTDYQRVADLGGNVVRLNLWWKLFEDAANPYVYKAVGWQWLEKNIVYARAAGVRLILDMHAPQGGFQGPGYTGSFYSSSSLQARLRALWIAIADRYKDEPWIAAYDILNEPAPSADAQWRAVAADLVDAIRTVDTNHLIIVEQSFADDYAPFLLPDPDLIYEFHFYERWRWASQLSHPSNYGDYGIAYPDADANVPPWDDVAGDLLSSTLIPAGSADWTFVEGDPMLVSDTEVFGATPMLWGDDMSGKVWLDDFVIQEVTAGGVPIRTLSSVEIDVRPPSYFAFILDRFEPFPSFTQYWSGASLGGSGSWGSESSGHLGDVSLSLRGTNGLYGVTNHRLQVAVKPGHYYRISGWVKTEGLTGDAGLGLRQYTLAAWETFTPFTKTHLENTFLDEGMTFYANAGVPVNIGELGVSPRNFLAGRGGQQWTRDVFDLLEQYGMSGQWFDWHSLNFGLYTNVWGFPEAAGANQPALDTLADLWGGPGVPNFICLAGRDFAVRAGEGGSLDGSSTVGTVDTWLWEQTAGDAVTLSADDEAVVTFTAPLAPQTLAFRLTATGPAGASSDTVEVDVFEPCPAVLDMGVCIDAAKAALAVDESRSGKAKVKAQFKKVGEATVAGDFGDPVSGNSMYSLCLYADGALAGELLVDRAGASCGGSPCWQRAGSGWRYKDRNALADGVSTVQMKTGDRGKGAAKVQAKHDAGKGMTSLPTGIAAGLEGAAAVTMQLRVHDGECLEAPLPSISRQETTRFNAKR